ncbi:hypothetical protein D3C84_684350 [compost metagenome]
MLAFVAVIGQRGVGLCITVQLVDEAIEQFVRGVEIQQIGVAGHTFLKAGSQAAHSRRQALLVGR